MAADIYNIEELRQRRRKKHIPTIAEWASQLPLYFRSYRREFLPTSPAEQILVEQLAALHWYMSGLARQVEQLPAGQAKRDLTLYIGQSLGRAMDETDRVLLMLTKVTAEPRKPASDPPSHIPQPIRWPDVRSK